MTKDPESYYWVDTLACGHTRNVETFVPIDRSDRVLETAVCFECVPKSITQVLDTRQLTQEEVDAAGNES